MARITPDIADTEAREAIEHMPGLPHDPTAALDETGKPRFLPPIHRGF